MSGTRRRLLAALAAAAVGAPAAAADRSDFARCDGFKLPGSEGGFTTPRPEYDFIRSGVPMAQKDVGEHKVAACRAALADPRLLPMFSLRRVHLLRALALAELQTGDPDAAIVAVHQAEEAGRPLAAEALYRRSLGLSLEMVLAAAWEMKGDAPTVRRLTAEIAAARPYSVSIQSVAAALARMADASGGVPADASTYLMLLPLMPAARFAQFDADIEAGQLAQAARLYPLLATRYPPAPLSPAASQEAIVAQNELIAHLVTDWNAAYAFAALGDVARSRAIEADARAKLAIALAPPPVKKAGMVPQVSPLAAPLNNAAQRLAVMVEARQAIAERRAPDALKALIGSELPQNALSVELLTALKAALPPEQAALAPDPAAMAAKVEAARKEARLNVTALAGAMPVPETRLAKYGSASSGFLTGLLSLSPDGFHSRTDAATGITTIEFVGQSTSAPVVEEMTLLRAADLARQQGKAGLLIVDRHDYRRTTAMVFNGIRGAETPNGYKTELQVRFVDPAALPSDLASERDRLLDVNAIYAALAPIYVTPAPTKP